MALTKVSRGLLSTGIVDNSNATAITLNADESATFTGTVNAAALTVDTTTLVVDATNNDVGIGSSSPHSFISDSTGLYVAGQIRADGVTNSAAVPIIALNDTNSGFFAPASNEIAISTGAAECMRITSTGVGIGVTSPQRVLVLSKGDSTGVQTQYTNSTTGTAIGDGFTVGIDSSENAELWNYSTTPMLFATNGTERARITGSDGHFLVGNTVTNPASGFSNQKGFAYAGTTGQVQIATNANNSVLELGKNNGNNGDLITLRQQSTTVGSIGSRGGTDSYILLGGAGLTGSVAGTGSILPTKTANSFDDNVVSLGFSSARFKDAFVTNGVTTGSDRILKQDIEELSDAEKRVAVAAKALLRKYRWKDAVAEKGDDARIHVGIIAQDLQDAFTAEGLDAARYGMWCSDTWTDDDGSEQTRLSVRYSELLAFIIAAI